MQIIYILRKATKLGIGLTALSALLLVGCGGTGSSAPVANTLTLGGVAAVGSPIVNATVKVSCAAGSALADTTTNSTGVWQVALSGQTLPCAIQVSGGTIGTPAGTANTTPYHSIATTPGTVNVTPLTDLIVASLAGVATPGAWFSGLSTTPAPLSAITQANVDASLTKVRSALSTLTPLGTNNPITMSFTATPGTVGDDMLSALKTALTNASVTHAALLTNASQATFTAPVALGPALTIAYQGTSSGASVTRPSVSGFSPLTGTTGTAVTITGANLGNFTPAPVVKFGTTVATPTSATATSIVVSVPTGLATGNSTITLSNLDGTGVVTVGTFTVTASSTAPALVSFSPVKGLPGDTITIAGTNLSTVSKVLWVDVLAPVNLVTQIAPTTGVVEAGISAQTATSITVTVPAGLPAGSYYITAVYPGSANAAIFPPSSAYVTFAVSSGGTNSSSAASNPKGIILTSTYPNVATAATIAPMVGHYIMPQGLLTGGSSLISNCTLDVATDGTFTLAGGGYTYTASVSGKTYYGSSQDWTSGTNTGTAAMNVTVSAADFKSHITVVVSDGNVFKAVAPGLTCTNPNPNQTTVGTALSLAASVATASNLSPAEVGTYKNADNCQLVISSDGTMRFALPAATALSASQGWSGTAYVASNATAIDASALLGGDHGDFTNPVYPQITAKDYKLLNGHTIKVQLFQSTASYSDSNEQTLEQFSAASCNNMVKQ